MYSTEVSMYLPKVKIRIFQNILTKVDGCVLYRVVDGAVRLKLGQHTHVISHAGSRGEVHHPMIRHEIIAVCY